MSMTKTVKTEYTFLAVSDIHIDREGGGEKAFYRFGSENFTRALQIAHRRGVDFLISAGDQITDADEFEDEWREYRRILDGSDFSKPVFAALGNHETRTARDDQDKKRHIKAFLAATREDRSFGAETQDKPYFVFKEPVFGDIFLFMAPEGGMQTPFVDEFSDVQLRWAEKILERAERENRRVFLIQHATIRGFGAGDDIHDPAYAGSLNTDERFPGNRRFLALLRRYQSMIWLSGHSHVDFRDDLNFSDDDGKACRMLHIPALCGTTRLSVDGRGNPCLDYRFFPENSQGYLVKVSRDETVFYGMDLYHDKVFPQYTFRFPRDDGK